MVRMMIRACTAMLFVTGLTPGCGSFVSELNDRCIPKTCTDLGKECGAWDDGCGGEIHCAQCQGQDVCHPDGQCAPPRCQPVSCDELGMECGVWEDGCGSEVDCGECQGDQICRADGQCVSHCDSSTCEEQERECGIWNDGCFTQLDCGSCGPDETCDALGKCVDTGLAQEDRVSDCGGFQATGGNLFDAPLAYCDAEVLHWLYEEASQTLKLANARVFLNCCGEHSMTVQEQDGLYLVTEIDAPDGGFSRCGCMCVFDFALDVQGVPPGIIRLKLVRVITDWEENSGDVFEGEIDLSEGSGSIVVDNEDLGDWCQNPE